MKSSNFSFILLSLVLAISGCGRPKIDRIEWPIMGTIAAIQTRTSAASQMNPPESRGDFRKSVQTVFTDIEKLLNVHDPKSVLNKIAPLSEDEILATCDKENTSTLLSTKACYEAAFKLMKASGGAFNPRWRGENKLDLGAIAKGFAVDAAAKTMRVDGDDTLLDLGGNLKSLRGTWRTGVMNPNAEGYAAKVNLHEGEALATSATYYRGSHIYDGRTGKPVTNGVVSVTVLCKSAMWADGLSTTLFVLGPDEGRAFLATHQKELLGDVPFAVLWILSDNRQIKIDPFSRFN